MRILIAAIIGGLVIFIWGAFTHMATPLGTQGFAQPRDENVAIAALKAALPAGNHAFILPSVEPSMMNDPAVKKSLAERSSREPFAFITFRSEPRDATAIGGQLVWQFVGDFLSALFIAIVMASAAMSFCRRVIVAALIGLVGVLSNVMPFWNWYAFPSVMLMATFAEQLVGWLLAGAAMAWWLGRGAKLRGDYIACGGRVR